MTTVREAVEARDLAAIEAMLAEDVVFHSPVVFKPYHGKAITAAILSTVIEVFENFRYVREIHDADGRIVDFMVMVRPLRAAQALQQQMSARFAQIEARAAAKE